MTDSTSTRGELHLEPTEVVGYVGHTLRAEDRRRVERHLADCDLCTEEVAAISRLGGSRRRHSRWLPYVAAAAVLAGIVLLLPRGGSRGGADTLRDGTPDDAIAVVAPLEGAAVAAPPTLVWRGVPGATTYRVMVTGLDGDSLWAAHTSDTAVTLPETIVADSGLTRHWYVDALLSDGGSRSTGVRAFRTSP
jgi:anti-sigma factor RsiW